MIKFFNKIIRNEKIIEKYASGSLHLFFSSVPLQKKHPRTTQYVWLARALARPISSFAEATEDIRYTETLVAMPTQRNE